MFDARYWRAKTIDLSARLDAAMADLVKADTNSERLGKKAVGLETSIKVAHEARRAAQDRVTALEEEARQLQAKIDTYATMIAQRDERIEALRAASGTLTSRVVGHENQIAKLANELLERDGESLRIVTQDAPAHSWPPTSPVPPFPPPDSQGDRTYKTTFIGHDGKPLVGTPSPDGAKIYPYMVGDRVYRICVECQAEFWTKENLSHLTTCYPCGMARKAPWNGEEVAHVPLVDPSAYGPVCAGCRHGIENQNDPSGYRCGLNKRRACNPAQDANLRVPKGYDDAR